MEGGLLPWKIQKIENNSPDLDSFSKPLPPPPTGFCWERQINGEWTLIEININNTNDGEVILSNPSVLEHLVLSTDTLQGICLRYRFKKTLRIPIDHTKPIKYQLEDNDVKIQRFKNETNEEVKEAKFYLETNNWDLEMAISNWRGDEKWTSGQSQQNNWKSTTKPPFQSTLNNDIIHTKPIKILNEVKPLAIYTTDDTVMDNNNNYHHEENEVNLPLLG